MVAKQEILPVESPTICLVDDDSLIRTLFSRVITRTGCDVIVACGVTEAQRVLAEHHVHIVLSDLKMPNSSDGEQLLRYTIQLYPHIPICMMSGDWSREAKAKMMEFGASACILKPFTADIFENLIEELKW